MTKVSNAGGDGSVPDHTTSTPNASDSERSTTTYETSLKNVKLNLSVDFDLADLNEEEKKNLESISKAYGLDHSNDQVVVDAKMKEALQIIAAKMTPELRQKLGFKLKDLTSSCIMNGEPCDLEKDFKQSFDVDYGNCYTFNYDTSVKYVARRAGTSSGKLHLAYVS
ncbi:Degenerin unc-8 [Aphelenchoides avenae]|nr:Degenerin unc-8 [Aphelenchus avenae]